VSPDPRAELEAIKTDLAIEVVRSQFWVFFSSFFSFVSVLVDQTATGLEARGVLFLLASLCEGEMLIVRSE